MGVVAVACGVTCGVGDADEVAASVVGVGGNPACGIVDGNRQVEGFVVVDLGAANEIVKEQMIQTTSKKIVRSSEKQKSRACVPHTSYVRTKGFVQATACCSNISCFFQISGS